MWTRFAIAIGLIAVTGSFGLPGNGSSGSPGILLGLRHSTGLEDQYVTLWLVPSEHHYALRGVADGIITRRTSGFWRAAVDRILGPTRAPGTNGGEDHVFRDHLLAKPASSPSPPLLASRQPDWDESCQGSTLWVDDYRHIELLYVGSDYVSFEQTDWSSCGAAPGGSTTLRVVSLDGLETPVSIGQLLGRDAYDRLLERAQQYLRAYGEGRISRRLQ